jgi:hypothetical protein
MQRKNNFLKNSSHQIYRDGIAMIMAISVIVIIGTILALSLSFSSKSLKNTTDIYLYEQAQLLSKSATEYALLKIAQDGPCSHTDDLNFVQDDIFDINISLHYIYTSPSPCTTEQTYTTVTTPEQNGSVLMDVWVSVPDQNISPDQMHYFRRTLQKL